MKKNQAILRRVEKYRERKGLKIIDQSGKLYLFCKIMYILSFVWFAVIHLLYFAGEALILADPQKYVTVSMQEFYILCGTTVLAVVGFVLLLLKKHIAAGIAHLIVLPIDVYQFYALLILKNKGIDSEKIFLWRHLAPVVLMLVFCGIMCLIAIRAQALLNRDYKKVLEALYVTHKDRLGSGTEKDWENLLAELDDNELEKELERQHTRDYKKKKVLEEATDTEESFLNK